MCSWLCVLLCVCAFVWLLVRLFACLAVSGVGSFLRLPVFGAVAASLVYGVLLIFVVVAVVCLCLLLLLLLCALSLAGCVCVCCKWSCCWCRLLLFGGLRVCVCVFCVYLMMSVLLYV